MSKKDNIRRTRKHIPQRTCVGCRSVLSKKELIRIVNSPQGILVDLSGKMSGRGAYLHNVRSCWEKGLRGSLGNALKRNLTDQEKKVLLDFMESLPETNNLEADMDKNDGLIH